MGGVMEKELTELFESAKRAADVAENSPGEEDRCLDALTQLKNFPVDLPVLVSTQVGKRLRQLTKHKSNKIKALASDVVDIWKGIVFKETKNAKDSNGENGDSVKTETSGSESYSAKNFQRTHSMKSDQNSASKKLKVENSAKTETSGSESNGAKNFQRTNSMKSDQNSAAKILKVEENSDKGIKSGASSGVKIEKGEGQIRKNSAQVVKVEKVSSGVRKPSSNPAGPPKLSTMVYCKDPVRDKLRDIFGEALARVFNEVDADDDTLKQRVNECDPYRVAVFLETAMFDKWGKSTGAQKFKYRSIIFNIKDPNNPDFRRRILIGEIEPREVLELTPDQMASDERQGQNEKIKEKMMLNSERAAAPKASTNEFTCGRCKKKETTYYQMQTRSADEPMTTFVTCVNCGNHWKFC